MARCCSRCKRKLPFLGGTKWLDGTYVCDACLADVIYQKETGRSLTADSASETTTSKNDADNEA